MLVRILNNSCYDGTTPNAVLDTLEYFEYFSGTPYNANPAWDRPRLIVESNSVRPDFQVMLFPHRDGDLLPETDWNVTHDTLTVNFPGEEKVLAFAGNGSVLTEVSLVNPIQVGIEDVDLTATISVYPNPADGEIRVDGIQVGDLLQISSSDGRVLRAWAASQDSPVVDISEFASGAYFLRVERGAESEVIPFRKL